jgi:hypothetical protein
MWAEGNFVWSSGDPATYRNWSGAQPDNYQGREDYGMIFVEGHGWPSRKWNDFWNTDVEDHAPGILFGILQGVVEVDAKDIDMQSAQLVSGNTVQFTYETTGKPGAFQVGLYRSADNTFEPGVDPLVQFTTVTPNPTNPQAPGSLSTDPIPLSSFYPDLPYLLVVADPITVQNPVYGALDETDDVSNNVAVVPLPDVAMQSASLTSTNLVQFAYTTTGSLATFQVGLYRSADGVTYDPAAQLATKTITPNANGGAATDTIALPSPWTPDPIKPYLVVVADPAELITESDPNNNKASLQLPRVIVETLPVGNPVMGADYQIQVRVGNNTAMAVTLTLGAKVEYISAVNWKKPQPKKSSPVTITLAPGESRVVTLGTFNHSWEWLPKNPPTLPSDVANQLYAQIAPNLPGLLTQLLEIVGKAKTKDVMDRITSWFSTFSTQLDILSLVQQASPAAQVNYTIRVVDIAGETLFSQMVPVIIHVSQEQQSHLTRHLFYFVLAEQFRTGIPALDFVLVDAFQRLAKKEYKAAR